MPLYDATRCPHLCDLYSSATATDAGGGTSISYTLVQSDVPCWAPSTAGGESERFGQQQMTVEHTIHTLASAFTTAPQRGWKLVVNGYSLHIVGINTNQSPSPTIPSLIEIKAQQLLG